MDWQLPIVGVLVVFALVYLARQTLRSWRGQRAGCGGCKHHNTAKPSNAAPPSETLIPVEQIRLRRR